MLKLGYAPYRLSFRTPFGTAHGMREGTDAVFIRLERNGLFGYGEVTMPPYVAENTESVIRALNDPNLVRVLGSDTAFEAYLECPDLVETPATRAGVHSAYNNLINKSLGISSSRIFEDKGRALPMVTLGHGEPSGYAARIAALPSGFPALKIKLGTTWDREILAAVVEVDERPILLDVNQGWNSIEDALDVLDHIDPQRVIGIEQPFHKDRLDLHQALTRRTGALVIADESVQGIKDLEHAVGVFGGVNLKLMKCGGLDYAGRMALRARELGLSIMLGSMSESTLGCATMLALAGLADLADLDGPWLLSNDPFTGMEVKEGRFVVKAGEPGTGVEPRPGVVLDWIHIGA